MPATSLEFEPGGDSTTEWLKADDPLHALAEQLAEEMARSWGRGQRVRVEDQLERHPQLLENPQAAFRLICEEICLSQEVGLENSPGDWLTRFPQWQSQLQILLECHDLLQPQLEPPDLSPDGPELADFRTLAVLGSGGQGQVFLAQQRSLGDRPVVIKITSRQGREHLSLARLQHTHIVPLFWVHDDPDRDRRVLCMPYFGTVTLRELLQEVQDKPLHLRSGRDLLNLVDRAQAKAAIALPGQGPARPFLAQASYVQAVCWLGACLADALHHAHDRGLVHLDLKPSNVLLAGDGQPMLLDFHLARAVIGPGKRLADGIGGTPMYMSPEQRALVAALCEGKPIPNTVDGRSDIYSLGLILHQLLGGPLPRSGRLEAAAVPVGLDDVVLKCLADNPANRYADAGKLAADLRRQLADQPLRGVPNRSWKERWQKWRRRKPHSLNLLLLIGLVVGLSAGAGFLLHVNRQAELHQHMIAVERELRDGRFFLQEKNFDKAVQSLEKGLELAEAGQGAEHLSRQLAELLPLAKRQRLVQQLHDIAEEVRFLASSTLSSARAGGVEKECRALWENRDRLRAAIKDDPDPNLRQQVYADLLDLAVIWTNLRVGLAKGPEVMPARLGALEVLAEAERLFGPSAVLAMEQCRLTNALGRHQDAQAALKTAEQLPPQNAWDHYALGRSFLAAGELEKAASHLEKALALAPSRFWPNFYQGICAYRLGQYPLAVSAFRSAIAIQPDSARAYFNRALAYAGSAELKRAESDYGQALRLDPTLAVAALNRGILYFQQERFAEALGDLHNALAKGSDPALTHFNLALVCRAQNNFPAARAHVQQALRLQPGFQDALALAEQLKQSKK